MAKSVEGEANAAEPQKETTVEFLASIANILVSGLFIITFIMQAFEIPSSSMEDTLLIGDHLFVNRVQYAPPVQWLSSIMPYHDVQRNDIVVFVSVEGTGMYIVKRIVGVPGDHLHLRNGELYRNGEKVVEPYVVHKDKDDYPYRDNFPLYPPTDAQSINEGWAAVQRSFIEGNDIVVPPNCYFGMGDNRDQSYDSRFWGFIPRDNVVGRPMFIYWSFDTPPTQVNKRSLSDRIEWFGTILLHFFDRTRWSRTLMGVR